MNYFVYIIINLARKPYYTYVGYTNNIKKRLELHNSSKGAKFTRGRRWRLLYSETCLTKREAILRECYIKKNRRFRNKIKKNYLDLYIIFVKILDLASK